MSDQNIITDWKAYFAAMGPMDYTRYTPAMTPMYVGLSLSIVFLQGPFSDVERIVPVDEDSILDVAKEVYEANGGPEMWVFISAGGPREPGDTTIGTWEEVKESREFWAQHALSK